MGGGTENDFVMMTLVIPYAREATGCTQPPIYTCLPNGELENYDPRTPGIPTLHQQPLAQHCHAARPTGRRKVK